MGDENYYTNALSPEVTELFEWVANNGAVLGGANIPNAQGSAPQQANAQGGGQIFANQNVYETLLKPGAQNPVAGAQGAQPPTGAQQQANQFQQQPDVSKAIAAYQNSGHTPGYTNLSGNVASGADYMANALLNPKSGQNAFTLAETAAKEYGPAAVETAYNLMPPAQFYGAYKNLMGDLQNDDPMMDKAVKAGTNALGMLTSMDPIPDATIGNAVAQAMMIGPMAKGWKNLVKESPYAADNIPLGSVSSLYGKFGPMVEVENAGRLAENIAEPTAGSKGILGGLLGRKDPQDVAASGRARDVWQDDVLYENYPELADVPTNINLSTKATEGSGRFTNPYREVYASGPNRAELEKNILPHEFGHAVADVEGWPSGGNPAQSGGFDKYRRTVGEIQARIEALRAKMTPEEKARIPFWSMADVPPEKAIVLDDDYLYKNRKR